MVTANCDTAGISCSNLDKELFFQTRFHLHLSLATNELASSSLKMVEMLGKNPNSQNQQNPLPFNREFPSFQEEHPVITNLVQAGNRDRIVLLTDELKTKQFLQF